LKIIFHNIFHNMKKFLIFIGPPGSGKGTQAKKVSAKYGYKHVSTGDLLRNMINRTDLTDEEKVIINDSIQLGKLAPDWFILKLVFNVIEENIFGQGVVFDGAIRTVNQAEELQNYLEKKALEKEFLAVAIMISDEEAFARLTKRRVCEACQEIIPWVGKAKDYIKCPKCGGNLKIRHDDNEEVIKDRIDRQGSVALQPIVDYYKNLNKLKIVDGMGTIEEVEVEVDRAIKS